MTNSTISLDCSGPVWQLTLNRPTHGNACSSELIAALESVLQRVEQEMPQALIVRGAGRHFCTGFDLSGIASVSDDELLARFIRIELVLQRLARAPCLTVAVAQGRATGAGADLFAACEIRLVSAQTQLSFPGARGFGLVLGTRRLCLSVGQRKALQWIESAATISHEEALLTGLATGLIDSEICVLSMIQSQLNTCMATRIALRRAVSPYSAMDDAMDLKKLIESAAKPGLKERIQAYIACSISSRSSIPASTQ